MERARHPFTREFPVAHFRKIEWQELDLVRRFERDGDKEGFPCRLVCVADSRSEVEKDPLIPVTTHSLPKQTFEERQQHLLPFAAPHDTVEKLVILTLFELLRCPLTKEALPCFEN